MSSFIKIPFRYKIYGRLIVFYFAIWWYDFFIDIFIPDLYFKNFKYKHIPYVSTFIIYDLNNYFIWFSRLLVLDLILSFILKNNKVYFFDTSDIPSSFWGWAVLETIAIWVGYIIYFNIVTYCRRGMKYLTETVYSVVSHEYDVLRRRYNACYLWEEPTDASSRLLGMRYYPFTDEDYSTSNPDWNYDEMIAQGYNKVCHFHWDTNKNIAHVTDGGRFKFTGAMFQLLHSILFGLLYI